MSWSKAEIRAAFDAGVARGATHMLVIIDAFASEAYPLYVQPGEDARAVWARADAQQRGDATLRDRLAEVYLLALGWEAQAAGRVMNWEAPAAPPATPELDRRAEVLRSGASQTLTDFLDWLAEQHIVLARYEHVAGYRDRQLVPDGTPPELLLERHFGLDGARIEEERRALLAHLGARTEPPREA